MARAKKKSYRSLRFKPSPEKKDIGTTRLLLTLTASDGDVVKVEKFEKSGQRREVTEREFAELAGEGSVNLGRALERAYTAGVVDTLKDELSEDDDNEDEEKIVRRIVLKRAARRQTLRRRVRTLIMRRAIRRQLTQRHKRPEGGAARNHRAKGA